MIVIIPLLFHLGKALLQEIHNINLHQTHPDSNRQQNYLDSILVLVHLEISLLHRVHNINLQQKQEMRPDSLLNLGRGYLQ